MIVAMLALFVALTGTAVATTSALITGAQIKNSSITGADVKNRSLRPIDFRGSVRGPRGLPGLPGATGAAGAAGAAGAKGDKGDTGEAGDAVAYAAVNSDGTVGVRSKGITTANISHTATTGEYCFGGLSFTPKSIIVSGDNTSGADATLATGMVPGDGVVAGTCPAGFTQARVRTVVSNTAALTDRRFVVWFED